jgi:hypothetical protein
MAATPIDEEFRTGWRAIQRLGARVVLSGGAILLGAGAIDLSHAAEPWQLYPCNLVMGLGGSQFHSDLDNLGTLVRPPPRPRAQPRADRGKRRGVRRRTHTVDSESAPRLGRRRAQGRAEPVGGDCALDLDRHPVAGRPTAAVGGNHSRAQGARDHRPQRGVAGCAVLVGRGAIRTGTRCAEAARRRTTARPSARQARGARSDQDCRAHLAW